MRKDDIMAKWSDEIRDLKKKLEEALLEWEKSKVE